MAVILQTICIQMDNCETDFTFSKYVEQYCFVGCIYSHTGIINARIILFYKVTRSRDWHS